jgi:hypothetical protein
MQLDLRTSLYYHLQSNHYPPVDPVFIDTAIAAIDCVNAGDYATLITMPNDITKSALDIVAELHLDFYLYNDDEEWDQNV